MCDDCPASFSRHVVHIGPPRMANGRIRARKAGHDLSTQWARQRCFPVKRSLFWTLHYDVKGGTAHLKLDGHQYIIL